MVVLEFFSFADILEKAWYANPLRFGSRMPEKRSLKVEEPKVTIWPTIISAKSYTESLGVSEEPLLTQTLGQ